MRMTGDEAAMVARKTLSSFSICLGVAALAATVAVAPADAKKNRQSAEIEAAAPAVDTSQPMTLIVSLGNQKVDIYRGTTLITSSSVSTGKRGHATKAGVFSILEKRRRHYSNLYNGAPMPWMQRLTWSGTALHAGVVPGYPASHGCIRLPYSFAPKLFDMTTVGGQVVVSHGRVEPKLIEHATLFQPLPPPMPPIMAKDHEQHTMRRSSNETAPVFGAHLPVVLAKAETDAVVTDAPQSVETPASAPVVHGFAPAAPAPVALTVAAASVREDTRVHAIDPNAAPFVGSGAHAVAVKAGKNANRTHAEVGTSDDFIKNQDRLAAGGAKSRPALAVSAAASSVPAAPAQTNVALVVPAPGETPEPQAGPILSVSAAALPQPVPTPVLGVIAMAAPAGPPPLPPAKPSVVAAKLVAGAAAAAAQAAEPRSTAPLRVLVTRRTQRDRMIGVQYILASMGHLEVQDFDGTFGRQTASAIKDFQKAHGLPETGAFTDDVVQKIYEVAGKEEPPTAQLFVRQEFASVFDTPVTLRNPDEPLGTHVFTVMNFTPGETKAQWMAVSLKDDDDPSAVLDRIEIPEDVRQNISERLTPGSSFIIADTAINSATLPKGADFLVWDTSKPAKVHNASVDVQPRPRKTRRATTRRRAPAPTYSYRSGRSIFPF
jgi:peptidoglycan hydrolase-like protein with peptidoglycan-binding domain